MLNQENRLITIDTPLGTDFFIVESFHGTEAISNLFSFDLELRAESMDVTFSKMIDQPITLNLNLPDSSSRFFNGIVAHFSQTLGSADLIGSFFYKCTIVPWTWTLTQTSDLRIFVDKRIPDIIEEVLGEYGFSDYELSINKKHSPLPLCTQFQESDFAFLSRIMERAGIFYFFKHEKDRHIMVITDTNSIINFYNDEQEALFKTTDTTWHTNEHILDLYWREKIRSRQITLKDYNSEMPGADLISSTDTNSELGSKPREFYEFPGDFTNHEDAENISKLRMEEQEAKLTKIKGKSTYRTFQAGTKFTLDNYFRQDRNNKTYLLTAVEHTITRETSTAGLNTGELQYWNDFNCIPTEKPFRPPRKTKKPKVYGVQIATVTSDPDEYGEVSIEISWDRHKKTIPKVPVSQIMAGENWGTMFIPHPGHEVVVDFIGGDPDKPVIVGRLYNGDNKPQYELPAEKTKSVIYSKEGNEIVLEDKKGDKYIRIEQTCGNEVILHEKEPRIELEQKCGNRICLDGKDPSIEIVQKCGNRIYVDGEDESISMYSPAGHTEWAMGTIPKGKTGFHKKTDGDWYSENIGLKVQKTFGAFEEYAMSIKTTQTIGLESQTFLGGKHETHIGTKHTWSHANEYGDNYAAKKQKVKSVYAVDSKKSIELSAGPGGDAQGVFDKDGVWFETGGSVIDMDKGSTITIDSKKDIMLKAKNDVVIKGSEIYLESQAKVHLKGRNLVFEGNKINIG